MSIYFTINEVAERLNCSDDQVRILIANRDLPCVNIGSGKTRRCIRVSQEALNGFIESRTSPMEQKKEPRRKSASPAQPEWV